MLKGKCEICGNLLCDDCIDLAYFLLKQEIANRLKLERDLSSKYAEDFRDAEEN